MIREDLIMVVCSDIAGQIRGKSFPAAERKERLRRGIGWTPTNVQITCFGSIAPSPFGALGDLLLVPDRSTEVLVDFEDGNPVEHFMIGDIQYLDGKPWECCTRSLCQNALAQLEQETGLNVYAAFEHEFHYSGGDAEPGSSYSLRGYRQAAPFAQSFIAALRAAGLEPDTFMAEYGPAQYEVTTAPSNGLRAADDCVILREIARTTALRLGERVSFAPLVTREIVGNGVHIHLSLRDREQRPVMYDPDHAYGLSRVAGQFAAGILRHLPAMLALTAASVPSYQRLVPHRWSAAYNNLGYRDREAAVRICPLVELPGYDPARQFNLEYRGADASASPYLQLATLVWAGLQGIREQLPIPEITTCDPDAMNTAERERLGIQRLPLSLDQALDNFAADDKIAQWFPALFLDVYQQHKRFEIEQVKGLDDDALCARYAQVY